VNNVETTVGFSRSSEFVLTSKHRVQVTPAKRGKGTSSNSPDESQDRTPAEPWAVMTWAQRLKRVFNIEIETCGECGGAVKVVACIEDPVVIGKILTHLNEKLASAATGLLREKFVGSEFSRQPRRDASNNVGHRHKLACSTEA
jgi:hypothetical protein